MITSSWAGLIVRALRARIGADTTRTITPTRVWLIIRPRAGHRRASGRKDLREPSPIRVRHPPRTGSQLLAAMKLRTVG